MSDYSELNKTTLPPAPSIAILLLAVIAGFLLIGPFIGILLAMPFFPGSLLEMVEVLQQPENHPEAKIALYILQGSATLFGLIATPLLIAYLQKKQLGIREGLQRTSSPMPYLLTAVIVIVFMIVNSIFIEWNSAFTFPDFLKGFEEWARAQEVRAQELTTFLTRFESTGELIVALVVIAVLPAVGEELVFRGLIQNEMVRATRNVHVAIWISAILFSAIHIQFFGFVPRMLLGALFGYLYVWSGNLTIAMLAHFVNNGFSVVMMYFYQQGTTDLDMDSTESAPWQAVLFCTVLFVVLLYVFKNFYKQRTTTPLP